MISNLDGDFSGVDHVVVRWEGGKLPASFHNFLVQLVSDCGGSALNNLFDLALP